MTFTGLMRLFCGARILSSRSRVAGCGLLLAVTVTSGGCSMGSLPSLGGGLWGSNEKKAQVAQKQPALTEERLLAAAKQDVTPEGGVPASTSLCTKFQIYNGDRFLTVYNIGQYGDGLAVLYRGELTKAARECAFQPGQVQMKYGIAGRVLLGPKGQAGVVNLPVVVHLTDAKGSKIKSERISVPVTIDPGKPIGYFSLVKRLNIDLKAGESGRNYRVFVGFEKQDQG